LAGEWTRLDRVNGEMPLRIAVPALLLAIGLYHPAAAGIDASGRAELLAAQNGYRAAVGVPPLRWSDSLAATAQGWADHLGAIGRLEHSGPGQNLAMATSGTQSLAQLVALWGRERVYFRDGSFPSISTTGNWADAGHYSQIVWRDTTTVGCGFARRDGRDVLVCDYAPPGNVMGEQPY